MDSYLSIRNVAKHFRNVAAVENVNLDLAEGEMLALLGPSGCGKTTLLRVLAGLTEVDQGTVTLGGRDITSVPSHRRNISMVFQTWALFPHMTVAANVAFGLRMQGVQAAERDSRVDEALRLVHMQDYATRLPKQLSGGQQQRVALARAIVTQPRLLLLDEPLSSLDHQIRVQLRGDLRRLQRSLGLTGVYVTHDYAEALSLGDRIAVMRAGHIVEHGSPHAMFSRPEQRYTAEFLSVANVVSVSELSRDDKHLTVRSELGDEFRLPAADAGPAVGAVCLKFGDVSVQSVPPGSDDGSTSAAKAVIVALEYEQSGITCTVELDGSGTRLRSFCSHDQQVEVGDRVWVSWTWVRAFPVSGNDER